MKFFKKTISIDEIGLARVAFNKKLVDGIAKIKANKKLEDWKATFIQYKARCEKRKSWKDKVSQMKEIENKLALLNENDSDAETETPKTTAATEATKTDDSTEKQKPVEKTNVKSKPKKDLKEVIESNNHFVNVLFILSILNLSNKCFFKLRNLLKKIQIIISQWRKV